MKDLDEIEELVRNIIKEEIRLLPTKEDFFNRMDKLMKELKDMREEQTMISGQVSDHSDRVEQLESIHPQGTHAQT